MQYGRLAVTRRRKADGRRPVEAFFFASRLSSGRLLTCCSFAGTGCFCCMPSWLHLPLTGPGEQECQATLAAANAEARELEAAIAAAAAEAEELEAAIAAEREEAEALRAQLGDLESRNAQQVRGVGAAVSLC